MLLVFMAFSLVLSVLGQHGADDWLDPYDMINYDSSTKTMRNPTQPANYDNVGTKRREYNQDLEQEELLSCNKHVVELQRQVEDQKKTNSRLSQQLTCNPVFKRFLNRLLKDIERVGMPSESSDVFYDAKIKLSKQAVTEIRTLLEGEDRWRTGALDHAISQILVDVKPHDYIAWKWRFEDTFGVEIDTVIKIGLCVLIIVAIMCTQMWSTISWYVLFWRMFAVCFFISIIWNWLYLYKIAFAEHQNKIVKMDSFNEKCTGVKKIDWSDSLKELFRSTLTLQDDPCKIYYENIYINPILLVTPTKAIAVTITTFLTEPMKHIGQGISEFLRALLKDLPITLQIPVLLVIIFSIVVCTYGSVRSAFQYGIMAPLRRPHRDHSLPEVDQPQSPPLRIDNQDYFARGDVPPKSDETPSLRHGPASARLHRNQVQQRRPKKKPPNVAVKTLRPADCQFSENETDSVHCEENLEEEEDLDCALETENHQEAPEVLEGTTVTKVAGNTTKTKATEPNSSASKGKPLKEKETLSEDKPRGEDTPGRSQPLNADVQDPRAKTPSTAVAPVETVGPPVQKSEFASEE